MVVTALKLVAGGNFGAWGIAVGRRLIGWLPAGGVVAVAVAVALLLAGGWALGRRR